MSAIEEQGLVSLARDREFGSVRPARRPAVSRAAWTRLAALAAVVGAAILLVWRNIDAQVDPRQFLNVSYDPTRELYRDLNASFIAKHAKETGETVTIRQSHGGSARQSRAVIDGLGADVVTLAMYSDVDALRKRGLLAEGWSRRLPFDSLPYTSTIVFVVRKGNPRHIRDWDDLTAGDVSVITPNPKTSGNGKLSFLAAWGSVLHRGGTESQARAFVRDLYGHVAVLETGARDATNDFAQEKLGDVHLTWENEAILEVEESKGDLEIAYPSASIRAEPYVAWVDANVKRKETLALAQAYLAFLFTEQAQDIIGRHGYRPIRPEILERFADRLPHIDLFPVTTVAKDWDDAEQKFFADNGIFDAIDSRRR